METLTELIVRITDLAEAEGRVLRATVMRLAMGIGLIGVAVAAVVAGLALVFGSIYIVTAEHAGSAVGAALTGVFALAAGGVLAWLGHRMGT